MREQLKGISLVLFGILLCCAEEGINSIVFRRRTVSDCSYEKGRDKS